MALIVETGAGVVGANSYNTIDELDTYHAAHGNTAWAALSTPDKTIRAINGAQVLDALYSQRYVGIRNTLEQGLDWPRAYVVDSDGFAIGSDTVPPKVKEAHAEMSLQAAPGVVLAPQTTPGNIEKYSVTVGPISKSTTYAGGSGSQQATYPLITRLLIKLLEPGGRIWRG